MGQWMRSIAGLALGATAVVVLGVGAGLLFVAGQVQELLGGPPPRVDAERVARMVERERRKAWRRANVQKFGDVWLWRETLKRMVADLRTARSGLVAARGTPGQAEAEALVAKVRGTVRDTELRYAIACSLGVRGQS